MSKKLPCPSCKNTITIEAETLATSDSIQCRSCGSSFKLKKKTSQPIVSKPMPAVEVLDAEVVETAGSQSGGLDLGAMNFDEFGARSPSGFDPLADPLVDPLANPGTPPTVASSTAYYAPATVQVPASQVSKKNMSPATIITIIVSSVGGMFLIACGLIAFVMIRGKMRVNSDEYNMKMVSLALLNYESTFKRFPAPTATNAEKKPTYSWAVSIVPYTDDGARYTNIDYSTPLAWDAPGNEVLQGPGPSILRSARGSAKANERNVFVIKTTYQPGGSTKFPMFVEARYTSLGDVDDGPSNTIMAIQLTRYAKPWAQPADLSIDEAFDLIKKEPGRVLVVMVDGKLVWLPTSISREQFETLTTRNAGDLLK